MKKFLIGERVQVVDDCNDPNWYAAVKGDIGTVLSQDEFSVEVHLDETLEIELIKASNLRSIEKSRSSTKYRHEVLRTAVRDMQPVLDRFTPALALLGNAADGLAGEAGEFLDLFKKTLYHGAPLDRTKAIKELGDIRWYLELAAHCLDVSMEEIEATNIEKLRARYPVGFSEQDAQKRTDEKKGS